MRISLLPLICLIVESFHVTQKSTVSNCFDAKSKPSRLSCSPKGTLLDGSAVVHFLPTAFAKPFATQWYKLEL